MSSNEEEEKAFERLRREFPKSEVSLEKKRCSWHRDVTYYAYASEHDDNLYENRGLSTLKRAKDYLTADEAVNMLIEIREEEKKARAEGEKKDKMSMEG